MHPPGHDTLDCFHKAHLFVRNRHEVEVVALFIDAGLAMNGCNDQHFWGLLHGEHARPQAKFS